ncbi:class I SAM-dependent methyltransferase [archaeon]|nr:class I SAM-dependent methyltransferase [archaeon]
MGISSLIYDSWMREAQFRKYSGIFPMLERAEVDFSGKALDVGMGTGLFEDYLSGRGVHMDFSGIEPDEQMIREAKKKGYKVASGTAEQLPFQDKSFDFVVCLDTIHLVKDSEKALSEALRVLKKGKFLLLSHYCNTFTKTDVVKKMDDLTEGLTLVDKKLVGQSDSELAIVYLVKK